jgi:sRNA-binding carbon storage regulator CsrA
VLALAGNQVRLGIDAPKAMAVTRDDAVKRSPKGPKRGG